jgi:hypothetical protein
MKVRTMVNDASADESRYARVCVCLWLLCMMLCGCPSRKGGPSGSHCRARHITDATPEAAKVIVYGPSLGCPPRTPGSVEIVWDGNVVFSSELPKGRLEGLPVEILVIGTGVGKHVVKVSHGSSTCSEPLDIKQGQVLRLLLFGCSDGNQVLVQRLTDNVVFE